MSSVNERTFQGELYRIINDLLKNREEIHFKKITQEENVGRKGEARFADGKLYSSTDTRKIVSFELKDAKWDATDEVLVMDAMKKAFNNGYEYFVTGTPRQLAVYRTFEPNTTVNERKLKIYTLSNVKDNSSVLLPQYEKEISPKLIIFLKELSDLIHGIKEVHWDSIDKFFVNKLSSYILEASAEMVIPMHSKINKNKVFREDLKLFLRSQDIFNVNLKFDIDDIYKICQLSNYFLYLKIIFYSYLQRDVPALNLKPLSIPADKKLLNKTLRERFDDVLKHDFEMIFEENILDYFEFEEPYIPLLKSNVEEIKRLNFTELNADIIGAIYNTLIDNQEQHNRGQHFTNTNEVDIVNGFCINEKTKYVLDSGCGAGTFLVRAYYFLKSYHNELTHQQLLEKIWGIEIASFPAFLSTMNLSLLDIKTLDNYPVIVHSDFSKIQTGSTYTGMFLNVNKTFHIKNLGKKKAKVDFPIFDACVGNPPYIRQELIENKEIWNNLAYQEFGLKKINQQSDLYFYYMVHTASFLKDGGRLGYVISSSWLDVSFGEGFQKFLLDNFKIIAIIDHQKKRSFETALINTVILILEKCLDKKSRYDNNVKFVRVNGDYEQFIGSSDGADRFSRTKKFCIDIENYTGSETYKELDIEIIDQKSLEQLSTIDLKYSNGYWGPKFLRSPKIYKKIISKAANFLIPVNEVATVKYGIKTGKNEFFYLIDETPKALSLNRADYLLTFGTQEHPNSFWNIYGWYLSELNGEHFIIEREYVRPVLKSQREAENLDVLVSNLKYHVLYCKEPKSKLVKQNKLIVKYINLGESKEHEIYKSPSVLGRKIWYDITSSAEPGDFIFPSKIGERFRLIDNRSTKVFCDKVSYIIDVKDSYKKYNDLIFLILNSTMFRYFIDLFARQMVVKVSDVDLNLVKKTLIINPIFLEEYWPDLKIILKSLKSREQETIYKEINKDDRYQLDKILLNVLGLNEEDVKDLHNQACKYVKDRELKSESLLTSKTKQKLDYNESLKLIAERFPEVTKYRTLLNGLPTRKFEIPEWKAKYPKNGVGSENLFGIYNVYFIDGKSQKILSFSNMKQLEVFQFFNKTLEIKSTKIELPTDNARCEKILARLQLEYNKYNPQIKLFLKSNRSSANHLSIYRDLLFSK